jgi:transposase
MSQLHKRFTSDQLQELLERYLRKEMERKYIQETLGISRRRFSMLLNQYRENPSHFTIQYHRTAPSRCISAEIEQNILSELAIEKQIIGNKEIPLSTYNCSFIKDRLRNTYHQKVSLNTIIHRAKNHGFYLKKPKGPPTIGKS